MHICECISVGIYIFTIVLSSLILITKQFLWKSTKNLWSVSITSQIFIYNNKKTTLYKTNQKIAYILFIWDISDYRWRYMSIQLIYYLYRKMFQKKHIMYINFFFSLYETRNWFLIILYRKLNKTFIDEKLLTTVWLKCVCV